MGHKRCEKRETGCRRRYVSMAGVAATVLLGLQVDTAPAHQHWIDVDAFRPLPETPITVHVCSGHYFPKSAFALKDNVFGGITITDPGDNTSPVKTTVNDKRRTGSVALRTNGVHVVRFTLKRPRATQPSYEAKALIVAGRGPDDPAQYIIGNGLELAPAMALSRLRPGSTLPLVLLLDGQRIPGSIEVTPAGKKSAFLKAQTGTPAVATLTQPGRYLVSASAGGRGCSLVFDVAKPPPEKAP